MASSLASRLSTQFDKALSTGHLVFTPSTTVIIPSGNINVSESPVQRQPTHSKLHPVPNPPGPVSGKETHRRPHSRKEGTKETIQPVPRPRTRTLGRLNTPSPPQHPPQQVQRCQRTCHHYNESMGESIKPIECK
ncbi:hypothetical protein BCR33DRAFT_718393 [Rhizoclosmatium globosum]|uniref:Uncharacterized protein n=1 Tax=Rhizoclosmatium globosum TaxID=329046 RepID=A0A1Y2C5P4_9FUNG|nr:hypothetical protein BCR33DRAFT_718393 [Rhizoclosmatium globosum]|eukprot:ORY42194.1 hypothetical protein BCR33DRAFT_718393 [Rhizoclosmatium globosum]